MNETVATFYPLNQRMGWREALAQQMSVGAELALSALPTGPLALDNPDGSLGHLTLPRGFALAQDNTLYLLWLQAPWMVLRYDDQAGAFRPLPGLGDASDDLYRRSDELYRRSEARRFQRPRNLAIAGVGGNQVLVVADTGNRRVQIFHLPTLALLHVYTLPGWKPMDVAGWEQWAFILDGEQPRVYRQQIGQRRYRSPSDAPGERLELVCTADFAAKWRRIAIDRDGRIYCFNRQDPQHPTLDVFTPELPRASHCDPTKGSWEHFSDAGDVRERFDLPAITLKVDPRPESPYHRGIFQLTVSACRVKADSEEKICLDGSSQESSATNQIDQPASWFTPDGEPVDFHPDQFAEPRAYQSQGMWISQALDSRIYRCQWHRIELEMDDFPSGTRLLISTYTSPDAVLPDAPLWQKSYEGVGQLSQPFLSTQKPQNLLSSTDFLVQSRPGQYLWLKIEFFGDGYGSPKIAGMRVHFPRQSYLGYLPAVYSEENSRWFMERFLSIFQTEWDGLEMAISRFTALFDPAAVPAENGFLDNLARWLGLTLEGGWNEQQKRRLLETLPGYYPHRGTLDGLRTFFQVYLQNMTGLDPTQQGDYPVFIEGFRRRMVESFKLKLGSSQADAAGPQSGAQPAELQPAIPLWGPGKVGRLQLNRYSTVGEGRLVSTGDPQLDLFYEYAHRFQVFIPSIWIRTAEDERRLRRALDAEKPAQTAYELCLVEPRFRVGLQSTVGVDTILGSIPQTVLTCKVDQDQLPPSQAPRGRLGYDTILASRPGMLPRLPLKAGGGLKLP